MSTTNFIANSEAYEEIERSRGILDFQIKAIGLLIVTAFFVGIVEYFKPSFFDFPYLQSPTLSNVSRFWPLFLYAAILSCRHIGSLYSTNYDEEQLGLGLLTSTLAGTWEEFGFRCLLVCVAMIGLIISNFVLGTVLSLVIAGALMFFGFQLLSGETGLAKALGALLIILGIGVGWIFFSNVDPEIWVFRYIIAPVIHVVSFGMMKSVLYGDAPELFVFGMIIANAWFRDGHKYQGLYGLINSWYIGLAMMYATVNYGLWTAIIVHVLYDMEIDILRYGMRKLNR